MTLDKIKVGQWVHDCFWHYDALKILKVGKTRVRVLNITDYKKYYYSLENLQFLVLDIQAPKKPRKRRTKI